MSDPNYQPPADPSAGQNIPPQQPYTQQPPQPQQPYAQQPQQPYSPAPGAPLSANDDKQVAMWSHIGGIIGFLPSLILYLVFKDRGERTRVEAKEALNWQITFTIFYVALWIVFSIASIALLATPLFGLSVLFYFLPGIWWIVNVIFSILGGVRVNAGGSYRYPINFRFIS